MRRLPFDQRIPKAIAVFGIFFVVLSIWSINRSISNMQQNEQDSLTSAAPAKPYEERRGAGLRWNLDIRLDGTRLIARLQEKGEPVSGVEGRIRFVAKGQNRELPLRESAPGEYTATFPSDLQGRVAARIILFRGDASMARGLLIGF